MDNDYINDLNNEEKMVFMKMFCKLIKADEVVDNSELEFLNVISSRFGIDKNVVVDIIHNLDAVDYIEEAKKITNRQHALELIKELCVLANIDESLDNNELNIIVNIAEALDIEYDKLVLINRWVLDSLILNKAGNIIMEKNNE